MPVTPINNPAARVAFRRNRPIVSVAASAVVIAGKCFVQQQRNLLNRGYLSMT